VTEPKTVKPKPAGAKTKPRTGAARTAVPRVTAAKIAAPTNAGPKITSNKTIFAVVAVVCALAVIGVLVSVGHSTAKTVGAVTFSTAATTSVATAGSATALPSSPAGYPQVVAISALPAQVMKWMTQRQDSQALALAPGVWTELRPGTTAAMAQSGGTLSGFCPSIKAYEAAYLTGAARPSICW
jgi:hypothetical protein